MIPQAHRGFTVSRAQMRTKAFDLITEAEDILYKPELREEMRIKSVFGALTPLGCYKKALTIIDESIEIFKEIQPESLATAEEVKVKILAKINQFEKPTPPPEPVKEKTLVETPPEIPKYIPPEVPKIIPKKTTKKKYKRGGK